MKYFLLLILLLGCNGNKKSEAVPVQKKEPTNKLASKPIENTICKSCLCLVYAHKIMNCNRCKSGEKEIMKSNFDLMNNSGEVLISECRKADEMDDFQLKWD